MAESIAGRLHRWSEPYFETVFGGETSKLGLMFSLLAGVAFFYFAAERALRNPLGANLLRQEG
jgi:hypothetical protein